MEQVLTGFRDRIVAASNAGSPLRLRGNGTKDWYGQQLQGEVLDTTAYTGIVDYDPTELVITARCGTNLREIGKALSAHNQMLAFEPMRFDGMATIGGIVAAGLSGPRRMAVGAVRDFVLGAVMMDGRGEVLHFGGQVMKNVAGYDVSRLLTGSLGTLGLILEVSVKVLPKPVAQQSLQFSMTEAKALHQMNVWGGQPLPISASCWYQGQLTVRLSGARAAVDAAIIKMGGEVLVDADAFWDQLREHQGAFFAESTEGLWRLSVPSATAVLQLPGETLTEWGGAQRWLKLAPGQTVPREALQAAGRGHATLFRGGDKAQGVFTPLASPLDRIHRELKKQFDPAGVFNRGRLYPDF